MKRFLRYTSLLMAVALVVVNCTRDNDLSVWSKAPMKVRFSGFPETNSDNTAASAIFWI